jgi:hypothetical protein
MRFFICFLLLLTQSRSNNFLQDWPFALGIVRFAWTQLDHSSTFVGTVRTCRCMWLSRVIAKSLKLWRCKVFALFHHPIRCLPTPFLYNRLSSIASDNIFCLFLQSLHVLESVFVWVLHLTWLVVKPSDLIILGNLLWQARTIILHPWRERPIIQKSQNSLLWLEYFDDFVLFVVWKLLLSVVIWVPTSCFAV